MLNDSGRALALYGISGAAAPGSVTHIGLLEGGGGTLTELTGGSPAYARKAVTWNTPASGQMTNNGALAAFDVPASTTVFAYGLYSALSAGTFYGHMPLGGYSPFAAVVQTSASTDLIESDAHGLSNDQSVFVYDVLGAGLPTGLAEQTRYYVVNATTDNFQVSATQGGAAVSLTGDGELFVCRVAPETFGSQGTLTTADTALVVDARLI